MEPAAPAPTSPVSAPGRESTALRARRLAAARRRASALLAGVTVLFVAVTVAGAHGTLLSYVQAGGAGGRGGGGGRLVRGDGPVPPSAGPADTAHRADRRAQGPVRGHARPVRAGELPERGCGGRADQRGSPRSADGRLAGRGGQRRAPRPAGPRP